MMSEEEIARIRKAQHVVATAVHPDTGELLPWAMRFSSFIPMNLPIAFGLLFAAPTTANIVFFQWINQTYNASLNYANRNASSTVTTADLLQSYGMASTSAITVGLGIRHLLAKQLSGATGSRLICLNALTSFFAVGAAGFLNAYFMRKKEMETGIEVMNA